MRVLFMATAVLVGCGHTAPGAADRVMELWDKNEIPSDDAIDKAIAEAPTDEMWWQLEHGHRLLQQDPSARGRARARDVFVAAAARFEDTAGDDAWTTAWSEDHAKAYRARGHERVLTSLLLGIVDAADDRCDLALPSLRSAMWFGKRDAAETDAKPTALAAALVWWCSAGAGSADQQRADDDAALSLGEHMTAMQQATRIAIAVHGTGPNLQAAGAHGETTRWQDGHPADEDTQQAATMRASGLDCGGHRLDEVVIIVLCRDGHNAVTSMQSLPLWSSTREANSVRARRFDEVLAQRAHWRQRSDQVLATAASSARADIVKATSWQRAGLGATRWVAATSAARINRAVVNPAADLRFVSSLPEAVDLILLQ
jgi:hypothetical protein